MTALTVSPKFQVVISKAIRHALKLKAGQKVYMRLNDQGQAVLEPELDIRSARGFLPKIPGVVVAHIENDPEGPEWPGGCAPMDDAIIWQTAQTHGAALYTQDAALAQLPGLRYQAKP